MGRNRILLAAGATALGLMTPGLGYAGTTTVSHSEPCNAVSCTYPTFREDSYAVTGASTEIPPVCALVVAGQCVAGVQGNPNAAPGSGAGTTVSVATPGPGISVKLTICNNRSSTTPAQHCPNTTRIVITVITPDGTTPGVTVSRTCAKVLGGSPVPCVSYP